MKICSEAGCGDKHTAKGFCAKHYQRSRDRAFVALPVPDGTKVCAGCGKEKSFANFSRHGTNADGFRSKCRDCYSEASKEWRTQNERQVRSSRLQREFGISVEEYEARLTEQGGRCAICSNKDAAGRQLAVDHDHATGKVRGLLCINCNTGLGSFGDDLSRLATAVKYLLKGRA